MQDSPAYKQNHSELQEALRQGVLYRENHHSMSCHLDVHGHTASLVCAYQGVDVTLPVRTVLVATGLKPNVAYHYEHRHDLSLKDGYYRTDGDGMLAESKTWPRKISIIGDLNPQYQGSVVGALASAKDGYEGVLATLPKRTSSRMDQILDGLSLDILNVGFVTSDIVSVEVRTTYNPGEIGTLYRLMVSDETRGVQTVIARVVAIDSKKVSLWFDRRQIQGALIGISSIAGVMGPSGIRLVPQDVGPCVVISDASGWIPAVAIAREMISRGGAALLIALDPVPDSLSRYFQEVIEFSDQASSARVCQMNQVTVCLCIQGAALKEHHGWLNGLKTFSPKEILAVVDGPMMCLMKGVCGQCIQWQVSPDGSRTKAVFSCSWPSQPIEIVDMDHLMSRQQSLKVDEILQQIWYDCLNKDETVIE